MPAVSGGFCPLIDRLTWLHLSDLHFKAVGGSARSSADQFSQQVACQKLLKHLQEDSCLARRPQFVLMTGDVAFSGKAREYEEAHAFFDKLSNLLSVAPQKFFFVPGNHDIDRSIDSLAFDGAIAQCTSQQNVDRVLEKRDFSAVFERQQEFWSFVETFAGGQKKKRTKNGLAYVSHLSVDGVTVSLLGLNSAWLCRGQEDDRKLLIGERQIIDVMELAEPFSSVLTLGLVHHPIDWLYEWDQGICRSQLLPKLDLFHRGHLHSPDVSLSSEPGTPCVTVAAGSGHANRFFRNSYNLISLDLGSGKCTVSLFEFSADLGRYHHVRDVSASIPLKGKMPGDLASLQEAICQCIPIAEPYAGYMSSLLMGHSQEVPVQIDGVMGLFARDVEGTSPSGESLDFLNLRNRLRLYDPATPLLERINGHQTEILKFVEHLEAVSNANGLVANQIKQKNAIGIDIASRGAIRQRSYVLELLEDLRTHQDWPTLEAQARRHLRSAETCVAAQVRVMLVEALIHSDQAEKHQEGAALAKEIIKQPSAEAKEYLLACGAAESIRDDQWASELAITMVAKWPENLSVRDYLRGLAIRLGSRRLREALEKSSSRGDVS